MINNIKSQAIYKDLLQLAKKREIVIGTKDNLAKCPPEARDRIAAALGGLYIAGDSEHYPFIWLNPRCPEPRERVFAHELAHHMCRRGRERPRLSLAEYLASAEDDPLEARAGRFADKLIALLERKHRRMAQEVQPDAAYR